MAGFVMKGALQQMLGGIPDLDTDVIKMGLLTTLLNATTDKNSTTYGRASLAGALGGVEHAAGGGYTAGGNTLTGLTISVNSNQAYFTASDTAWTTVTLTSVLGAYFWDDTVTSPVADPIICQHDFGGSGYSVAGGNFNVAFAAGGSGGIFYGNV